MWPLKNNNWSGYLGQPIKEEKQFCNGTVVTIEKKCRINPNKPAYMGTSILHLSKILMQDFYYNYIKINMVLQSYLASVITKKDTKFQKIQIT